MDQLDRAGDLIDRESLAIDQEFRARREREAARPSLKYCRECEDPIPEKRRQAVRGVQYCTTCAEVIESMKQRGLHHPAHDDQD